MTGDLFPEAHVDPTEDLDSRFTLPEVDAWCRRKARVEAWDLDAAACAESHLAPRFYTLVDDGLKRPWSGNVWVNPPFSAITPWVVRAWDAMRDEHTVDLVAMLLPGNRCEQAWWQELVEPYRDRGVLDGTQRGQDLAVLWGDVELETHWLPGRTRFGHPGNPRGLGVGSPPFGCVLLVWRRSP